MQLRASTRRHKSTPTPPISKPRNKPLRQPLRTTSATPQAAAMIPSTPISLTSAQINALRLNSLKPPFVTPTPTTHAAYIRAITRNHLCMQSQHTNAAILSLWNRLPGHMRRRVGREDLKDVFEPAQSMIRTWGFRRTLQGVMPEDWGLVVSACEQRVRGLVENRLKGMGYDQGYICKAEARLLRVLQENGRVTTREVSDAVAHCFETDEGKEMANVEGEDGKIADAKFCLQYSLPVLLTVSHGLRRIDNHGQGTKLVKGPTCVRMGEEEAVRLCAERYFDVYGPAEELDFRYWTGLYAGICKNIVTELENEGVLLVVKRSGGGRPLYIHRDRMSQLSCVDNLKVDGRRRVWFLGRFDAMILAHKDKTWIVREENRKSVWGLSAEVAATVLVDGRMVGKWRRDDTRMEIILFTRYVFNESVLEEIAERATEILQWFWKQDRATVTIFDADRNELWSNT